MRSTGLYDVCIAIISNITILIIIIQRRNRPKDYNLSIKIYLKSNKFDRNTSLAEIRVIDLLIVAARSEMKQVR